MFKRGEGRFYAAMALIILAMCSIMWALNLVFDLVGLENRVVVLSYTTIVLLILIVLVTDPIYDRVVR